jgi:hypothetical protein
MQVNSKMKKECNFIMQIAKGLRERMKIKKSLKW